MCDTPRRCIQGLHDGLTALSLENGPGDLEQRYASLEPLITATHDLAYIARFTVRRQWDGFTETERSAFLRAFKRLSVLTYASRFVRLSEDTFNIVESNDLGANRSRVVASISGTGDRREIPIEYVLQEGDAGWRIINIVADGVSDLALKRAEYRRVLADGSVGDLLELLESQIAAL